ncbi:MAG: DUF3810 family protein [Sediminibacterium sp.]
MYRFSLVSNKFILPSIWISLFIVCLIAPYFPTLVAQYYTNGLFPYWRRLLDFLIGWMPFAIGELVYIILISYLIIKILKYFISLKNFNCFWHKIRLIACKISWLLVQLFVVFQLLWGLNYLQPDPAQTLQLKVKTPDNAAAALAEMNVLTYELIQELNQTKAILASEKPLKRDIVQIATQISHAYAHTKVVKNQQASQLLNIKKAIFPQWGDYIGYLAFYQPITGEAIVRADLPMLTLPYTIAHEMAHQLGYASETEANFIAYLIATESQDPLLKYSMLLQMFTYAQDAQLMLIADNQGYAAWKHQIEQNKAALNPSVLKDRAEIRSFFKKRADKQIQASSKLYDQFLKWNRQAAGLASYADVLKWVRAYRLKTGSSTSYSR